MSYIPYVWDLNNTNTAPLDPALLADGYPIGAIPTSAQFNELWRNVSGLVNFINNLFRPGTIVGSISPEPMGGWLFLEDGSIGSATSGGTLLADPIAEPLYTVFWNSMDDIEAPVTGGRGVSAAADFAANKSLTLPNTNGRALINGFGVYAHGAIFGTKEIILTVPQLPAHNHEPLLGLGNDIFITAQGGGGALSSGGSIGTANGATTGNTGAAAPIDNRQESTCIYYFIKL